MNYFEMKKRAFMSIINSLKGFIRKVSGVPPLTLTDCVDNDSLINYSIEGDGVGDLMADGKYKIPIKTSGKNLFDINNYTINNNPVFEIVDGKITGTFSWGHCIYYTITDLDPDKQYVFSLKSPTNIHFYIRNIELSKNTVQYNYGNHSKHIITPDGLGRIQIWFRSSGDYLKYELSDIQLEEGIVTTEYEAYTEPATTNIYLDEPLTLGNVLKYSKGNIPKLPTITGTTIYTVQTEVQPSNMRVEYYSTRKEE